MITDVTGMSGGVESMPVNPKGKLGKNEFLKMLVAQLQNQDPLNPMKGDEMAAQLAQFSSLEQLANISQVLESQVANQQSMITALNGTTAMGVLGRTVVSEGNDLYIPESGPAEVHFDVEGNVSAATLRVFDERGRLVETRELQALSAGRQRVALNTEEGGLPAGKYTFSVEYTDANGAKAEARTYTTARVDGIRYGKDGPVFTAGPLTIPFGKIIEVLSLD